MKKHEPSREQELRWAITRIRVELNSVRHIALALQNELIEIRDIAWEENEANQPQSSPEIAIEMVGNVAQFAINGLRELIPTLDRHCRGESAWNRQLQLVVDNAKKKPARRKAPGG